MLKEYSKILDFIIILLLSKNCMSQIKISLTFYKEISTNDVFCGGDYSNMNIYVFNKITNEKINIYSYLYTVKRYSFMEPHCGNSTMLEYSFKENEIVIIEINKDFSKSLSHLFQESSATSIRMETWNNNNIDIENFGELFEDCKILTSVDLSYFNLSNAKILRRMFVGAENLEIIKFPKNINISLVEDFTDMFENCKKLKTIDLSNFNFNNAKRVSGMFNRCSNLEILILPNKEFLNLRFVDDFSNLFFGCSKLESIDLSNINFHRTNYLSNMFEGCSNLTSIDLSKFNFNYAINLKRMFFGCKNLKLIKWPTELKFTKIRDFSYMFSNCYNLTSINLPNINFDNLLLMTSMFSNCKKLKFVNMNSYSSSNNLKSFTCCNYMFSGCSDLVSLNMTNFIFNGIVDFSSMFLNCSSLREIELIGNLNTTGIENYFFLDLPKDSKYVIPNHLVIKTTVKEIIKNCYSLKELNFFNLNMNYNESITENINNLEGCLFNEYSHNIKECSKYMGFKHCGKCINQNIEQFCLMEFNQNNYKFYYIDTEYELPFENRSCFWSRDLANFLGYKFINNSIENKSYFTNFCKHCEICSTDIEGCIKCNNSKGYYKIENQPFNCSRDPPAENYVLDLKSKEWKICGERFKNALNKLIL